MAITIKDADGATRSTNWPPNERPTMLDQIRDDARKAESDAYEQIKDIRVWSFKPRSLVSRIYSKQNNDTGEVVKVAELTLVDGVPTWTKYE